MKLIKPYFEIIEQQSGVDGIYKQIESAGRTCYKSENKITDKSAKEFIKRMIKSGHLSMLEHGTVYLDLPNYTRNFNVVEHYSKNKYSKVVTVKGDDRVHNYVTTNMRVIIENGWISDLLYSCDPTEYHEKRITVKWTLDRVTGESFLRHRAFSFARESTRYCNYSKDRFGNEITFIIPSWINDIKDGTELTCSLSVSEYLKNYIHNRDKNKINEYSFIRPFLFTMIDAERRYMKLLEDGYKPQQARQLLPFSICSPLVMTGFTSDWKHFFDLRCDKAAHPDAQYLANKCLDLFKDRGYM